jgi:hypothetical protein
MGGFRTVNISVGQDAGFSVCLWYKVGPTRGPWQRLFDFGEGPASNNILLTRGGTASDNTLVVGVYRDAAWIIPNAVANAAAFAFTNQWRHTCLVYRAPYLWKVYLDGALSWNTTVSQVLEDALLTDNLIGTSNWNSDPPYSGFMDEFRIYARELSAQEVSTIYQWRGTAGRCAPCAPGTFASAAGQTACSPCASGTYSTGCGLTVCAFCSPGNYTSLSGLTTCAACPAGTYQTGSGARSECACSPCAAGTFVVSTGATACDACAAGSYAAPTTRVCGLIGSYQFEPGALLLDSSGSNQLGPALLTPGAVPTAGAGARVGSGCAGLAGGEYFQVGDFALDADAKLSICSWYNPGATKGPWQRIFDFGEGASNNNIVRCPPDPPPEPACSRPPSRLRSRCAKACAHSRRRGHTLARCCCYRRRCGGPHWRSDTVTVSPLGRPCPL